MMQLSVTPQGRFQISAFGEQWMDCPVRIAVDANGERDQEDHFVPVMAYERQETADKIIHIWRTRTSGR